MASTSNQKLCQLYSLVDIQLATKNFDDRLVIGSGGFGKVYKGRINGSSTSVAIKRLDSMSDQGAPEFRAEIETLSKLRHAHLVSLLGCCYEGKEMILVYEYMPNGTVYHHLHNNDTPLSWMQRLLIGVGAARGLDYLHTGVGTRHGIIHRDVKSSNILLGEDWAAKISDFGLAKLCPINQQSTYVNTGIKGTFGYIDPELFMTGKFIRKTDVFAFGVVLFELLSGRDAVLPEDDEDLSLARWAQKCVKERNLDQVVADEIRGTLSLKSLKEFAQIAYSCLHSEPKQRPTMSEVVVKLQLSVALQDKFESVGELGGLFGFTWNMLNYAFLPKTDKSVHEEDGVREAIKVEKTVIPLEKTTSQISGDVRVSKDGARDDIKVQKTVIPFEKRIKKISSDVHGSNLGRPKVEYSLNTAPTWPTWLSAIAGDAFNDWTPRRYDSFEKLGKIGHGTYNNVYKARDLKTGKIVALKKVRFDSLEPENVKVRASEIFILKKLNHPNIIKLKGLIASVMCSSISLVFEYMECDLFGLAAAQGVKFTEPQIKCLILQLLSGLEHCHKNGVLHKDIKASDILINNDGILKIANFGLSSFYDPLNKQPMSSSVVTLSLGYQPPEFFLGDTSYGVGVDLWSVGCILAELLAGKPIMPGCTEIEQLQKIFNLCGSPSKEYWKRNRLPTFKRSQPHKRCMAETFKDFPSSSLPLLESLLAIDPSERGSAIASLNSDFFTTEPYACYPSELPKYPRTKQQDVKFGP